MLVCHSSSVWQRLKLYFGYWFQAYSHILSYHKLILFKSRSIKNTHKNPKLRVQFKGNNFKHFNTNKCVTKKHKKAYRRNTFAKWKTRIQNKKFKNIKRIDNNCHIPNLVQVFSYVENGGLNLVSKLDNRSLVWQSHQILLHWFNKALYCVLFGVNKAPSWRLYFDIWWLKKWECCLIGTQPHCLFF